MMRMKPAISQARERSMGAAEIVVLGDYPTLGPLPPHGPPAAQASKISSCSAIQAPQQWDGNHRQGQNPQGARDRPLEEREYPPVRLDHGADEVLLQHGAEH